MEKIIGFTKDNEIIVANVSYERVGNNQAPYFSVSFDLSEIAKLDDAIRSHFEGIRDYSEPEYILDLCDEYECSPSDLADKMIEKVKNDKKIIMNTIDCSLYPKNIEVDDEDYIFISSSCGQHDTRDEVEEFVDEELYNDIHELWDNYHLKNIENNEETMNLYNSILDRMEKIDEEEVIVDYIRRNKI